jgi:hypothetical protein
MISLPLQYFSWKGLNRERWGCHVSKGENAMPIHAAPTGTIRRGLLPAAMLLIFIGWGWPAVLHAGSCVDDFKRVAFSPLEKASILAGKVPHITSEVEKARAELQRQGIASSLAELLDGRRDNYEFHGLWIDTRVKSEPRAELYMEPPRGEMLVIRYGGMMDVDGCFIQAEDAQMTRMIRKGLEMADRYNAAPDKKAQFLRALDAQAGKIEALSMSFSPRFEILMGFADEAEMRQVLARTRHIVIDYFPNPRDAAPWVENDLRVTYHLDDRQTIEKFVGTIPLSILK